MCHCMNHAYTNASTNANFHMSDLLRRSPGVLQRGHMQDLVGFKCQHIHERLVVYECSSTSTSYQDPLIELNLIMLQNLLQVSAACLDVARDVQVQYSIYLHAAECVVGAPHANQLC
jgi:hypothetical protein